MLPLLGYFTEGEGMVPSLVSKWMVNGALNVYMKTPTFRRGDVEAWELVRTFDSEVVIISDGK